MAQKHRQPQQWSQTLGQPGVSPGCESHTAPAHKFPATIRTAVQADTAWAVRDRNVLYIVVLATYPTEKLLELGAGWLGRIFGGRGYSMVSWRKAVLFGVFIWLSAFIVAFAIFPIRESSRPLFESIMPVTVATATVFFAHRYFVRVESRFGREGVVLGLVWMVISVGIDLPVMLTPSPMQMSLGEYVSDIGLTYVMIPVITTGIGLVRAQGQRGTSEQNGTGPG